MGTLTQQKDVSVQLIFAGFARVLLTLAACNIFSDASAQGKYWAFVAIPSLSSDLLQTNCLFLQE